MGEDASHHANAPRAVPLVCPTAPASYHAQLPLIPCFFLRFTGSVSTAWATSSNRQSGARIWAAWSRWGAGSWHPGGARD